MRHNKVFGLLLPGLVLSTVGGVMAQDATVPVYALTGTGGVTAFNLPAFDSGVLGHSIDDPLFGGMLGANFTAGIGQAGDLDVLLSFGVFGAFASGATGSWTDTFDASDSGVVVTGLSTPDAGSITLDPGGPTDVTVNGANGANITMGVLGPDSNVAAVSPDAPGFINGWGTAGAGGEAAYGAIADESGGIFVGAGEIDGLAITTEVSRSVFYGGADLTLGLAGNKHGDTGFVVYGGPSYRGLRQDMTTAMTIDVPEVGASVLTHPEFGISVDDTLTSHYFGGVLGGNVSFNTSPGMLLTLGAEGGLYNVRSSWDGRDTYSTCCGDVTTPLATTSPELTVMGPLLEDDLEDAVAFALRGNAALSWAVDESRTFTLGGNVEYLSRVATVSHDDFVTTGNSDDWTNGDPVAASTTFGWGEMWNYGITASLTGHF
ncbi:hypothetical protein [Devosia sp.]|uniref:hypothetical protein n=1 Tax=Devosia sp. TaxID=1871048 RepID=UPI002F09B41E